MNLLHALVSTFIENYSATFSACFRFGIFLSFATASLCFTSLVRPFFHRLRG
ncbi:MAG TPA: hypothetical protein VN025_14700 [Candidatus Dormibacteraeota bacterium]|jgi:hypothetical protein|nr:hypothetical protein [Candidatus Dormibacteraeota bacterium]